MRSFCTLFEQEFYKWVHRPSTYFVAGLFLFLMGFNFTYIIFLNTQSVNGMDSLKMLFEIFWLPTLFIIPIITMQTLSEEQRSGVLESTLSTPVSITCLVVSKLIATYIFYLFLWGLCLFFPLFTQHYLGTTPTQPFIQTTILQGGILFIGSTSFLFIALGLFASSLTKTQTLAYFLGFCFLFIILVGAKTLSEVCHLPYEYLIYIDFFETLDNLCHGILDIRPMIFHIVGGVLVTLLTVNVLESKVLR